MNAKLEKRPQTPSSGPPSHYVCCNPLRTRTYVHVQYMYTYTYYMRILSLHNLTPRTHVSLVIDKQNSSPDGKVETTSLFSFTPSLCLVSSCYRICTCIGRLDGTLGPLWVTKYLALLGKEEIVGSLVRLGFLEIEDSLVCPQFFPASIRGGRYRPEFCFLGELGETKKSMVLEGFCSPYPPRISFCFSFISIFIFIFFLDLFFFKGPPFPFSSFPVM